MLKDKERSFLWPFTLICFCWLSPCFVVALPNLNPVSPRLHHEPRSISTVLRALANLKKRCLFRRTRWWKPRNLCRCVSRKRQHLNNVTYKPCCVFSLQKQPKSQALKLYHGLIVNWLSSILPPWPWPFSAKCRGSLHKGESPNVVGTPTTCGGRQRIDWWEVPQKKH